MGPESLTQGARAVSWGVLKSAGNRPVISGWGGTRRGESATGSELHRV